MGGVLEYLSWRGDLLLEERPLTEADCAILSRASYFPFQKAGLPEGSFLTLGEAADAILAVPGAEESILLKGDRSLLRETAGSRRLRPLPVGRFRSVFDPARETQFCAVTFSLPDGRTFVSYRGTDNTLVGWKENLNMSFTCPVPAQFQAVSYLREVAGATEGPLILGGHSKGGNLAVYAGAFCGLSVQDRIEAIYNLDGPGFDRKVLDEPVYDRICGKIRTIIPQYSVVGMLLEHEEPYDVVRSTETGLLQHDLYSWEVQRDSFFRLERVTDGSRFLDGTVKDWLSRMSPSQREAFVDAVYEILGTTNASTLREMDDHRFRSTVAVLRSLRNLDEDTRKLVLRTLSAFLASAGRQLASRALPPSR